MQSSSGSSITTPPTSSSSTHIEEMRMLAYKLTLAFHVHLSIQYIENSPFFSRISTLIFFTESTPRLQRVSMVLITAQKRRNHVSASIIFIQQQRWHNDWQCIERKETSEWQRVSMLRRLVKQRLQRRAASHEDKQIQSKVKRLCPPRKEEDEGRLKRRWR
ncbi:unnamed protein product [Vicia faba]|uniref:Uncharacterized protein n=1 Tax=Vicia faba TaxID=3906 RepID=A0AAV1AEW8_VICFA|nr:unnamed protein product [Vicia faba]